MSILTVLLQFTIVYTLVVIPSIYRETIQQALRGIIFSVGNKMGESVRQNLTTTLLSFQSHAEVKT